MLIDNLIPSTYLKVGASLGNRKIDALSVDSKAVGPGTLFFALKGKNFDGHQFVSDVLQKGAVVVVENEDLHRQYPETLLVKNTRMALAWAAHVFFGAPSSKFQLVGVTGTNGKTTTAYLLKQVWDQLGIQSGLIGTVECLLGTERRESSLTTPGPLVLQPLFSEFVEKDISRAVMEVSSIALDQYRCFGSEFDVGIFTNLTHDHLDYHGDFTQYFEAKRKFFSEYRLKHAVFNWDDEMGKRLYEENLVPNQISISLQNSKADFYFEEVQLSRSSTSGKIKTPEGSFPFESRLLGKHNLSNSLGVLGAAYLLGESIPSILAALSTATGAPGRLERVGRTNGPLVFVDYAHTPDALENVLQLLRNLRGEKGGKILTVFGCGGDRDSRKRPQMAEVVSTLSDMSILTSDNPRTEDPEKILDEIEAGIQTSSRSYMRKTDRREAIFEALSLATPEDFVLIAGKGHETYQIIGDKKYDFDDRKVVESFYSRFD